MESGHRGCAPRLYTFATGPPTVWILVQQPIKRVKHIQIQILGTHRIKQGSPGFKDRNVSVGLLGEDRLIGEVCSEV